MIFWKNEMVDHQMVPVATLIPSGARLLFQ